jgi:L-asparaginase II
MQSEIMVKVLRADHVESIHRGHAAIIHNQGRLLGYIGNPGFVTYMRSTAKLFQAIPVITSGAVDRFDFTDEELALMCASHNGEDKHVATARTMLAKLGLSEDDLLCGAQYPFQVESTVNQPQASTKPTRLHNNCSGKHAGMLAYAKHLELSTHDYLSLTHPLQQSILSVISTIADYPEGRIAVAIDGCGVPTFALPLHHLALAFSRLASRQAANSQSEAAARLLEAITAHPFAVAGSGRFDTRLAEVTQGRIIGKMGAEGVYAAVHRSDGIGLAVKIGDGSKRALYPAVLEIMQQLGWLSSQEQLELESFHSPVLYNGLGEPIGQLLPSIQIKR